MKVEAKNAEPCVVALVVSADAEEVKADYKKVLNVFLREAQIPGFRKGKVPLEVIKQKFQQEIAQETQRACFSALYPKAVEEAKLADRIVELQGVTDVLFTPETGISFTARVEVRPEFKLPKYQKLAVKKNEVKVEEEAVTAQLEAYRRNFAKYESPKEDDVIADGDFVEIDYKGTLKGQPLSEIVPDQKAVCEATGFWLRMAEGQFLPEILKVLKGLKAGAKELGVSVEFPKDVAPEPLKGQKCLYDVEVKNFRKAVLPNDADFAAAAKAESIDKLRADFRADLEKAADQQELENRRNQAIEALLAKADFDVPPSLVRQQTQNNLAELAQRAQYAGLTADFVEKNRDQILADAETSALKRVRLSYVLLGIAEAEKLEVAEEEVTAGIEKMAAGAREKITGEELRKRMTENGQLGVYREHLLCEKALDFVLANSK